MNPINRITAGTVFLIQTVSAATLGKSSYLKIIRQEFNVAQVII